MPTFEPSVAIKLNLVRERLDFILYQLIFERHRRCLILGRRRVVPWTWVSQLVIAR